MVLILLATLAGFNIWLRHCLQCCYSKTCIELITGYCEMHLQHCTCVSHPSWWVKEGSPVTWEGWHPCDTLTRSDPCAPFFSQQVFLHSAGLLWFPLPKNKLINKELAGSPVHSAEHLPKLALALPQRFIGPNGAIVKTHKAQVHTHCRVWAFLHDSVLARAQLFAAAATRLLHNWWTVVISVLTVASGRVCAFAYVFTCQVSQPLCFCRDLWTFKMPKTNYKSRGLLNQPSDEAPLWFHGDSCTRGRAYFFTCLCHLLSGSLCLNQRLMHCLHLKSESFIFVNNK